MRKLIDVCDLRPGQEVLGWRDGVLTVTARTTIGLNGWATVHTDAGSFEVKLPYSTRLA